MAAVVCFGLTEFAFAQAEADHDRKAIQGSWMADKEQRVYVFKGDELTVVEKGDVIGVVKFTLDPKKSPRAIDLIEPGTGILFQGIYELKENDLKVLISEPGKDRPANFNDKSRILTFKRMVKK